MIRAAVQNLQCVLGEIVKILLENGLILKLNKFNFASRKIKFLGHRISGKRIMMIKDLKEVITNYPRINTKTAIRRLVSAIGGINLSQTIAAFY